MAQPYVGEIRMFAGNFAPAGWMFCEGQLLPISENETLFQLIGTTYGGDGESTFALPDLRGRIPIHQGNGFILAETGGAEEVTLTVQQIPAHSHPLLGSTTASRNDVSTRRATSPAQTPATFDVYIDEHADARRWRRSAISAGRRQPAAHQLPALPLRRLHHLAVRHLPVADLRRRQPWPIHSSPRSASSRSTSRPRAGRGATASSCRSRRTPRCSRCSARPTAATASRTSRLPDLAGPRADAPRPGPRPVACTISARPAAARR